MWKAGIAAFILATNANAFEVKIDIKNLPSPRVQTVCDIYCRSEQGFLEPAKRYECSAVPVIPNNCYLEVKVLTEKTLLNAIANLRAVAGGE